MAGEGSSVKQFACPSCSASISIRGMGQTTTLACEYCGAIIDVTSDDYKILQQAQKLVRKPTIPLGTRGVFFDTKFEVIGFLVRTDGTGMYQWNEYLLFNPYKGFRWLTESQGHWTFLETIPDIPELVIYSRTGHPGTQFRGETFKRFLSGQAKVKQVIGECFWRVEVGETVDVVDYIRPPEILSLERSADEKVASIGIYRKPEDVAKAFSLPRKLARPQGVAPHQVNPFKDRMRLVVMIGMVFLCLVTFSQCVFSSVAKNKLIVEQSYRREGGPGNPVFVTPRFRLEGRTANLMVEANAPVSNTWIYLDTSLVAANGQEVASSGLEVSYYFGRDSDGSWSEGATTNSIMFSEVPPGEYYLSMEAAADYVNRTAIPFTIRVRHDVPYWGTFLLVFVLILIYPALQLFRYGAFEAKRWADSDYAGGG